MRELRIEVDVEPDTLDVAADRLVADAIERECERAGRVAVSVPKLIETDEGRRLYSVMTTDG